MDYGIEEESKRKIIAVLSALFPQAQIYLFLTTMIFCISTVQCAEQCIIKSVNEQVNDLVFADCSRFSHEDLINFGLVCHNNHKYLCTTAQQRKNYISKRYPTSLNGFESISLSWHGYGSRADGKTIMEDISSTLTRKKLYLARVALINKGKIRKYFGEWKNFDSELSYKPIPFYTTNKELWFFAHGWENVPGYGLCGNVICYQAGMIVMNNGIIKQKYSQEAVRCVLCLCKDGNSDNKHTVGILLEYPYLLQAILKKGPVEKKIVSNYQKFVCNMLLKTEDDFYYLYHLKDIIIPDNYKEFVQHRPEQISYKTFDDLPGNLKKAITQQYEKQKNICPD